MIENYDDLILFLYFSEQKINLNEKLIKADPLNFVIPQLQKFKPEEIQSRFTEGIYDYVLMRLCSLIKYDLLSFVKQKNITPKRDNFESLISVTKHYLDEKAQHLAYVCEIINSLRLLRNCAEYRKGLVSERDLEGQNDMKIYSYAFEFFFEDASGNQTIMNTIPFRGPENAALKLRTVRNLSCYKVGEKIKPLSIRELLCITTILNAFFSNLQMKD
ncbi:MAG: hypothetical protein POELPBGB_01314 [Bacteroidia bacterium]|nr:hypothetical protein [Bacteroidia bacterium]